MFYFMYVNVPACIHYFRHIFDIAELKTDSASTVVFVYTSRDVKSCELGVFVVCGAYS